MDDIIDINNLVGRRGRPNTPNDFTQVDSFMNPFPLPNQIMDFSRDPDLLRIQQRQYYRPIPRVTTQYKLVINPDGEPKIGKKVP